MRQRWRAGQAARIAGWVLAIILIPFVLLYIVLLFMPIPLPFVRDQARDAVLASLPPSANLQLGDMALALEGGTWPVMQFTPVVYTDTKSGAKIQMKALDVGFSPIRVLIGQPGATITMVGPHLQVNQDLLGPRLANFEIENDPNASGRSIVKVLEGEDAFPSVGISASGVSMRGNLPNGKTPGLRSDNDWLIYNLEASEQSLGDILTQAQAGRFSRLTIRDGVMDMNDAVYGVFRQFTDIDLEVAPSVNGKEVTGKFTARFAGRTMQGDVARKIGADGKVRLTSDITNIDYSAFLPFINDPDSTMGVVGAGALSIDVGFDGKTGKIADGVFHVDMTGMDLRIQDDHFPIATSVAEINWTPQTGQFALNDAEIKIGQSSATISGLFVLGLDEQYGPTVGISVKAKDVRLQPNDLGPPATPFQMVFSGWSAPLYGALGIDRMDATKPGVTVSTKGRVDMLRKGLGFDLHVAGAGVSADDLKRLWPYFLSRDSRDWFVKNVRAGTVDSADMQFSFPVGTIATKGEDKPIPQNGMSINMVGSGVVLSVTDSMAPVAVNGKTRLQVKDTKVTVSADGANIPTPSGTIGLSTPALVIDNADLDDRSFEVSGQVKSGIASLVALARQQQPQALKNAQLPVDLNAIGGDVDLSLISTITIDRKNTLKSIDYAVNGSVANFASTAPIQGHTITGGQLSFTASQQGYQGSGKASVDGMPADIKIDGTAGGQPNFLLSSTVDVKDLKGMGFDVSDFLSGQVRFVAKPMPDGTIQMAVDIKDAGLTIKDLGITKAKGVPGTLDAAVKQEDGVTELSQIDLAFGNVSLQGSLDYDDKKGLQSAEFSSFALSPGDKAQLSLTPIRDGYALRLRGDQLDLKPMLKRFFGLGNGSGGPQATQFTQTLALDLDLKRALGFYKTTAYNMQLALTIKGSDIQKASLQAQLGNNKTVSVTTNPTPDGKVMSVAFNDLGSLLRFAGVYPRIEGGEGSLVMNTKSAQNLDVGDFELRNFALVNEANAAQILESHQGSRSLIARENKISFTSGKIEFTRRPDRIEVTNGVLTGDSVGGTMHGFIYTDRRQYDLVGTYVPLFGLNSVFQKLPIFGPILGGREGEGLIGVTFAIRGSLDKPNFQINPASILVPGAFRGLFEYRAKELPETPADKAKPAN